MVTTSQASYLIDLARRAILHFLETGEKISPDPKKKDKELKEDRGVFITLNSYPDEELRGCIGSPFPMCALDKGVIDNAISAAVHDPRFPHVSIKEMDNIIIEISILTEPELIKVSSPEDYPKNIKIGKDGLIIRYGYSSGLLLPQVPIEWNWNAKEFLSHVCKKAGLPKNMWHSANIEIYKFQAEIFTEEKPRGKVIKKRLFR